MEHYLNWAQALGSTWAFMLLVGLICCCLATNKAAQVVIFIFYSRLFYSVGTEDLFLHLELIFIISFSVFAILMQLLDYPD